MRKINYAYLLVLTLSNIQFFSSEKLRLHSLRRYKAFNIVLVRKI